MARRIVRRRTGFRKSWISRQEHFWDVANTGDFAVAAGSILDAAIVVPSDYAVRVGFERATVVRMRGWVAVQASVAATQGFVYGMFVVRNAGSAALDPNLTASLRDYDVLSTFGGHIAKVVNGDHSQVMYHTIDIPVKRKLTEDQEINMYVKASPGVASIVSYVCRTLVAIK